MPSANKTTNYGLNQWTGNEYLKRTDFNEDNSKIDAQLKVLEEQTNNFVDNKADLVAGKVPSDQLPAMNYLSPTGDGKDVTVTFTESATRSNIITGENLSILMGKIKKYFTDIKTVAYTGAYTDLSNTPTSLPANGGTSAACSGNASSATKLQTARAINGVNFDGTVPITVADGTKAPIAHASAANTYGLGTTANYGHVKLLDALTQSVHADGVVLDAHQGKVLKDLYDDLIASGSYTGDSNMARVISLGFTPRLLIVANYEHVFIATPSNNHAYVAIVTNGFNPKHNNTNYSGYAYTYFAFK